MMDAFVDPGQSSNFRKRVAEDLSEQNIAQRRRISSPKRSLLGEVHLSRTKSVPSDAHSFQDLACFAKGDTQPLGKSQQNPVNDDWNLNVVDDYEDILVTDPISSPNGFQINGFEQRGKTPITPGLSRRSLVTENVPSNGKSSIIKTPGSAIRRMFGGAEVMGTGGISLTQAFQQTPTQPNHFANTAHGPKSDPIFERPSPNWASIESPAEYIKEPDDGVFRPPLKPASASRQHDPIVDSDDIFQPQEDALPTPTQAEIQTVRPNHINPKVFISDSEYPHSEITLGNKTPLFSRKPVHSLPLETPDSRSTMNGFDHSSKMNGISTESMLRKEIIIAATPNSDSQPHSQMLPRADLPSSPPMIQQTQEPSLEFMNGIKGLEKEVQAALDTSLPFPPRSSELVDSSSQRNADDDPRVAVPKRAKAASQSEQNDVINGGESDEIGPQLESSRVGLQKDQENDTPFNKLAEIAAEPSQTVNSSLQFDLLDHDDEYEKVVGSMMFNLSGSSPVDPKPRRNKPMILQESPLKSQVKAPSQETVSVSQGCSTNQGQSQEVIPNIDLLQVISGSKTNLPQTQKHKINRPLKFLQEEETRNSKRQKLLQKNKKAGKSIWEYEETQLVAQSEQTSTSRTEHSQETQHAELIEPCLDTTGLPIRFPNRVLAYCKNPYNACYPATFSRAEYYPDGKYACTVVFDDGTSITVPPGQSEKWIFRLDLQIGDVVKVEGRKSKLFVVSGLTSMHDEQASQDGVTKQDTKLVDVFGHQKVILEPKSRDSGASADLDISKMVLEPISNIIVAPKEFHTFDSRLFIPTPEPTDFKTTTSMIPNSGRISGSKRSTMTYEHSNPPSATLEFSTVSKVFAGKAFAVSIDNEEMKRELVKQLEINGGRTLNTGLEEMFDLSNTILDEHKSNIVKSTVKTMEYSASLDLSIVFRNMGFTAVIADSHSRKEKHMQALALGLPVLHYRWVEDCISGSKVLPWAKYLLPAGQSSYLGGAIKSRILDLYDPSSPDADLKAVFERRLLLLESKKVIVVPGRGQTLSKRQRAFLFLMMGLGVGSLMQASDIGTAHKILEEQGWDYIYHDVESKSKKSWSSETEAHIITDEFVAQSLILGELVS